MRFVRRLLALVALLLLLGILAGAAGLWWTFPGGDLRAAIPGLAGPVAVTFDADGIPRIRAGSEADAAAALGLVHARDRMFQMDLMRRNASGRLSELAGRATLAQDRFMRTLGLRRAAEADLLLLPPDVRALLEAYARGVNAWIVRRGRFAAPEFVAFGAPNPWNAVDSLLWGKTMALYLSDNFRTELARQSLVGRLPPATIDALWPNSLGGGHPEAAADPRLPSLAGKLADALPAFPARFTQPDTASNAWAVDGRHSANGAPLLAGDPHLGFSLPGIWYLARLEWPGHVLAGATAPGVPMLVLGHNGRVAWTFTTTGADTQDLFVERPTDADHYATPDGPRPFTVREERIRVAGAPDEVLRVRETRHGPVVSDLIDPAGPVLSLAASNLQPGDTAAAGLVALDRATSVTEAGVAAAGITAPVQNLMVADRAGIGLFVTGRVPIRRAGDGAAPVPGDDGAHDWIGFAAGDALPHVVAPPSGRLVNANDRIAPENFPVFLGRDWFGDFRARRIRELLDAPGLPTTARFAAMQADSLDLFARDLMPRLLGVPAADEPARAALRLLAAWDFRVAIDRPQPLIVTAWLRHFADAVLDRLGVPATARAAAAPWPDIAVAALGPDAARLCATACDTMLAAALTDGVRDLAGKFGADPARWRWGEVHRAVFAHPILRAVPLLGPWVEGRIDAPGDDTTVDRGGMRGDSFDAVHGASFRAAYDLADLDASRFMLAPGQCGHPLLPCAKRLLGRWRDGQTLTMGAETGPVITHIALVPTAGGP